MKLHVTLDRENGPLHGSRLAYDYRFPDPEDEVLVNASRPPPAFDGPAELYQWQRNQERAKVVIDQIARSIAQSLVEGLAKEKW